MTQKEATLIWKQGADDAWSTFEQLFEIGKYHHQKIRHVVEKPRSGNI